MTIKDIIELKIFDENEQVVVLKGNVNNPIILYTGWLHKTPSNMFGLKVEQISSMGEHRRTMLKLNKYGWIELWGDEESHF